MKYVKTQFKAKAAGDEFQGNSQMFKMLSWFLYLSHQNIDIKLFY